jgi:predicted RNA binding protein YcfA (HicA-like mRNA interferase family)
VRVASLRQISGKQCVRILCSHFGFSVIRQKGSHIILRKETPEGAIGTVVPNHNELRIGTLKGILDLAKVKEADFARYI